MSLSKADTIEQLRNGKLELPIVSNVDLSGENLSGITIKETMFDYVVFDRANLAGAQFEGCFFTGCSFHSAILDNAKFTQSIVDRGFVPKVSETDFDISLDSVELPEEQKAMLREAGIKGFKHQTPSFSHR